jgi:hypothetical protein
MAFGQAIACLAVLPSKQPAQRAGREGRGLGGFGEGLWEVLSSPRSALDGWEEWVRVCGRCSAARAARWTGGKGG